AARLSPTLLGSGMVTGDFLRPAYIKAQFTVEVTQRRIRLGQDFLQPRNYWCGTALQNRLVNLCFQGLGKVCGRVDRRKDRRGPRQIAFGLCDSSLFREGIEVIRCDIENLIKLSQRFGETTEHDIGQGM